MKFNALFYFCLFMPVLCVAQAPSYSLNLTLAKFKQHTGVAHYKLLDCNDTSDENWDRLAVIHTGQFAVTENAHQISFSDLPFGEYCFVFFQDLNLNGELDLAANSIPKEPVGFSNNPSLFKGKPSPQDTAFEVAKSLSVAIKVNNKKRR